MRLLRWAETHLPALQGVYLFGSKAWGGFLPDLDVDLLFVVRGPLKSSQKLRLYEVTAEMNLEEGVILSSLLIEETTWEEKSKPLVQKVHRYGVRIWWKG